MKKINPIIALLIAAALAHAVAARTNAPAQEDPAAVGGQASRAVAAAPDVAVELSMESGDVIVRGWDRAEVRAHSEEVARIELKQYYSSDAPRVAGKDEPARRVEGFVLNSEDEEVKPGKPGGTGNVELSVPRGATVVLRMQSGDVEISGVAEARIKSASGDVDISQVSRAVDIDLFSGDITLSDSRGGVNLRSQSGSVEAVNVAPNDSRDFFNVRSTSGNIVLEAVSHAKVEGVTLSGSVHFDGPVAPGGVYKLQTTSGDVTMTLPADSSFKFSARVVFGGDIFTDFAVKADPKTSKFEAGSRLEGTVGSGSAAVSLSSYNGTVHLRKK